MSLDTYRKFFKPLHKRICETIRKHTDAKIALHTCGAVMELIPDLIDAGFSALNQIHVGASNMHPKKLKQEFGRDLVLWGGACDSQSVLPRANPEQVKEEARGNLQALMPGGGYVFGSINLIQSDVPPENIIALAEVVREFGAY
jgi:uroporphyrinogen decarboxylase